MQKVSLKWSRKKWVLDEDFTIEVSGNVLIVPKGFKTDLASIPRVLWWVIPPFGKHNEASVVHDYLYKTHTYPQAKCDKIFLAILRMYGVNVLIRTILYVGVRLFGFIKYNHVKRTRNKHRSKHPC